MNLNNRFIQRKQLKQSYQSCERLVRVEVLNERPSHHKPVVSILNPLSHLYMWYLFWVAAAFSVVATESTAFLNGDWFDTDKEEACEGPTNRFRCEQACRKLHGKLTFLEDNSPACICQSGFRPGRNNQQCIGQLAHKIYNTYQYLQTLTNVNLALIHALHISATALIRKVDFAANVKRTWVGQLQPQILHNAKISMSV
eukprot:Protomagalhaensia_sp_Gyna_25__3973@NODE_357_length_3750_cov_92_457289_g276_i0_p3_GENE_NODE_357_length_3750_cov_92_457289_g276_i0NODE_357_length_3750_cov_92_457289_g276_i0_p3_ORF_typecomplete_len199_score7_37TIL/PF01826_17/1_8e04TIL/PF01826_17/0_62cEGF/PF12662_7/3_8e03cEGF/PF12662_7/0_3_NODE_357_length_3750_cov_92_457289_g276_i04241020